MTTGRFLGSGGQGQVWSGIETETGRTVALKVLDLDAERLDGARREIQLLRRIVHEHVVRLLRVERTTSGRTVLVLEHAAGGSLRALVGARGVLDPGEVVTVLTPLAEALADLYARGLVHGDVSPGNVLFAADGRPLLADLGVGRILGAEPATHATPGFADPALTLSGLPSPAGDIYSLGALAWFALTGRAPQGAGQRPPLISVTPTTPPDLAALVECCLDADAQRRPGAAELAVTVYGSAPAEPVRLVPTDPDADAADVVTHRLRREAAEPEPAEPPEPPRRRGRRWVGWTAGTAGVVAAVAVALVLVGGLPFGARPDGGSSVAAGEPRTVEPDPVRAVEHLSGLRAQAFSTGDDKPLREANVAGSPALVADLTTLSTLTDRGVRLGGLSFDITAAQVASHEGGKAVVRATVVTGAHQVVPTVDGPEQQEVAASPGRTVTLTLHLTDGRWQVHAVA